MSKIIDDLEHHLISTLCLLPDEAEKILGIVKDLTEERDQLKQEVEQLRDTYCPGLLLPDRIG